MFRIFFFILAIAGISYGLSFLADMDGKLIIQWPGGEIQPTLMQATIALVVLLFLIMFVWTVFRMVLSSPSNLRRFLLRKKQKKGIEALSGGLIAVGSGDRVLAERHATQARKTLPNDPMTQLLRAQAAELKGDMRSATRIFESMLAATDTEIMGLRGLYKLALEQKEFEATKQYASRAVTRNAKLSWAVMGLFDIYCRQNSWQAAVDTLEIAIEHQHLDAKAGRRFKAVLLTALAQEREDADDLDEALALASEAHRLEPSLIPAAVIAGRIYAAIGKMSQAAKVVRRCWKINPHPDLALVSAFARPGDSVRDRLQRVQELAKVTPGHREAALSVAKAAIEAKDWGLARENLGPLSRGTPSRQVCILMARIEGSDRGDKGAMREWLARAVHAPKDPCWVADGFVSDEWAAISPRTAKLDAFEWKVPQDEAHTQRDSEALEQLLQSVSVTDQLEGRVTVDDDGVIEGDEAVVSAESLSDDEPLEIIEDAVIEEDAGEPSDVVDQEQVAARVETEVVQEPEQDQSGETIKQPLKESEAVETTKEVGSKKRRKKRTKIFVSPPAPDDPGPEPGEESEFSSDLKPVRF